MTALYLTPSKAAALAGVSRETLQRWAREGLIRALRTAGGHHRYDENALREMLCLDRSEPSPGSKSVEMSGTPTGTTPTRAATPEKASTQETTWKQKFASQNSSLAAREALADLLD